MIRVPAPYTLKNCTIRNCVIGVEGIHENSIYLRGCTVQNCQVGAERVSCFNTLFTDNIIARLYYGITRFCDFSGNDYDVAGQYSAYGDVIIQQSMTQNFWGMVDGEVKTGPSVAMIAMGDYVIRAEDTIKANLDGEQDVTVYSSPYYLDQAHSVYHAQKGIADRLEQQGYIRLPEQNAWQLKAGGKYYVTRGGTALVAFRIPEGTPRGFLMSASHSDRPGFKLKENGNLTGIYDRLGTERYGGAILSTWLDRPLSIAGRVTVRTEDGVENRLIDLDRDLLLIPNAAIHMNRKVNEGYAWNLVSDLTPLVGGADSGKELERGGIHLQCGPGRSGVRVGLHPGLPGGEAQPVGTGTECV